MEPPAKKQNSTNPTGEKPVSDSPNRPPKESFTVNKKGFIEMTGEVVELLPAATFKVQLDNGQEIHAHFIISW